MAANENVLYDVAVLVLSNMGKAAAQMNTDSDTAADERRYYESVSERSGFGVLL